MNRNNYLVILEEIIKGGSVKRKKLPVHFNTLLPPDQVPNLYNFKAKNYFDDQQVPCGHPIVISLSICIFSLPLSQSSSCFTTGCLLMDNGR